MSTLKELLNEKKNRDNARARDQKSKKNITNYSNESFVLNVKILELRKNITDYEKIIAQRDILYNAKEKEYYQTDGSTLTDNHLNDLLTNVSYGKIGTQTFKTVISKWKKTIEDDDKKIAVYQKKIAEQQIIFIYYFPD